MKKLRVAVVLAAAMLFAAPACRKDEQDRAQPPPDQAEAEPAPPGGEDPGGIEPGAPAAVRDSARALSDKDPVARMNAAWSLGGMGPAAWPAVEALTAALRDDMFYVRGNAAWALGRIGPKAASAAPALGKAMAGDADEGVRLAAGEALSRLGPAAIDILAGVLGGDDAASAGRAAAMLGRIGAAATESLVGALKAGREEVVPAAAEALGRIGEPAIGALLPLLKSEDPAVRAGAVTALGLIGPKAKGAVEHLQALVKDPDGQVEIAVARALGRIGSGGEDAARYHISQLRSQNRIRQHRGRLCLMLLGRQAAGPLGEALKRHRRRAREREDEHEDERQELLSVIAALGPKANSLVPQLLEMLAAEYSPDEEYDEFRRYSLVGERRGHGLVGVLEAVGPPPASGVPALAKAVKTLPPARAYALGALGRLGPSAAGAVDTLVWALGAEEPETRFMALLALGEVGPAAEKAVDEIIKRLSDDELRVRLGAIEALGKIGRASPPAVAALAECLSDEDSDVCVMAAEALARLGPPARAAEDRLRQELLSVGMPAAEALLAVGAPKRDVAAVLIQAVAEQGGEHRRTAIEMLGQVDVTSAEAVRALLEVVEGRYGRHEDAAKAAREVRGRMGPESVPALIKAFSTGGRTVRERATEILMRIGPPAEAAVPALVEAMHKETEDYYESEAAGEAAKAVGKLGPAGVKALLKEMSSDHAYVRRRAAYGLGEVEGAGDDILQALLAGLSDSDMEYPCAAGLRRFGPRAAPAVPRLVEMLEADGAQWQVTGTLAAIGAAAEPALPLLRSAEAQRVYRGSENAWEAIRAIDAAVRLAGREPREAVEQKAEPPPAKEKQDPQKLVAKLDHRSDSDRLEAATALADPEIVGPVEGVVQEGLKKALEDRYASVRLVAACALAKAGKHVDAVVKVLAHIVETEDIDYDQPTQAAWGLADAGRPGRKALLKLMRTGRPSAGVVAAETLLQFDDLKAEAIDCLTRHSRGDDDPAANYAVRVLREIPLQTDREIELLIAAAKNYDNDRAQDAAVYGLCKVWPGDVATARRIEAVLADHVSGDSEWTAIRVRPETLRPEAVPILVEMLASPAWDRSKSAARALDRIDAGVVIPAVVKAIREPNRRYRHRLVEYLAAKGPLAASAAEALVSVVADSDRYEAGEALAGLARMGPAAAPAVPSLVSVAHRASDSEDVDEALAKIGPARREDFPKLMKLLQEGYSRGRAAMAVMRTLPLLKEAAPHARGRVVSVLATYVAGEERFDSADLQAAVTALEACGDEARPAVQVLAWRYAPPSALESALRSRDRYGDRMYGERGHAIPEDVRRRVAALMKRFGITGREPRPPAEQDDDGRRRGGYRRELREDFLY